MFTATQSIGGEVGRGRSGVVYFDRDSAGRDVVEKVFGGDGASRIVLYTLTGAPNPYVWNADAIACAVQRRRILARLVRHWFGDRLRLPRTDGSCWRDDHRAFALRSEFISGGHAPLRHAAHDFDPADPRATRDIDAIDDLVRHIMRPLQRHLRASGFDGLVWQAGLGNPVASNNFMLEHPDVAPASSQASDATINPPHDGPHRQSSPASWGRWVWIDLESGVPAWFPMNPVQLFRFYLPKSIRHGRPLFDDADVERLRAYLVEHRRDIELDLGDAEFAELLTDVDKLDEHQRRWKAAGRLTRSVESARVRGRITDDQASYYRNRPIRWNLRLAAHAAASAVRKARSGVAKIARYVGSIRWGILARSAVLFATGQSFRTRLAHRYVMRRIGLWEHRGQMPRHVARNLRRELHHDESAEYITDFGVHLALKPIVTGVQITVVPALVASGLLTPFGAAIWVAVDGVLVRSAYTLGRTVQASFRRQRLPIVALLVGLLPAVGNLAYPAQFAWCAEHSHRLARFVIYDAFATIGRKLPIWGGPDTLTEHFFNRLPDKLTRWLPRRRRPTTDIAASPATPA